ncbi:MAG: Nif3-like dinuclear metal center hexameric protein, partial [Spirochaetales bacterium]|nr:Nif3-like dinuclear metal center hexameric protein [Spirochaetales bacterium]
MNVFELEKELYKKLEIAKFTNDISLNGLQVGNREQEVKK